MKKIFATLIATAMLSGGAIAQTHHISASSAQQQQKAPAKAPQKQQPAAAKKAAPSRYPAAPAHWSKRPAHEWQAHVDRCQKKYRSYNPRTDRYTVRHGQTALCRL